MHKLATYTALILLAVPVLAHADVQNPAVKERMANMDALKQGMGIIGGMAKGAVAFDTDQAQAAITALLTESESITANFEANETDPKSEALPAIWTNWDDFSEKADDLTFMLEAMDVSSLDTLRAGLGNIGGACGACHKQYRMDK